MTWTNQSHSWVWLAGWYQDRWWSHSGGAIIGYFFFFFWPTLTFDTSAATAAAQVVSHAHPKRENYSGELIFGLIGMKAGEWIWFTGKLGKRQMKNKLISTHAWNKGWTWFLTFDKQILFMFYDRWLCEICPDTRPGHHHHLIVHCLAIFCPPSDHTHTQWINQFAIWPIR